MELAAGGPAAALFGSVFQQTASASSFSQMGIYGVGCNCVEPVAKLPFSAVESVKIFNNTQKYSRSNIFCCLSVEKPVRTIAKYGVLMSAIQPGKCSRAATGLGC